MATRSSPRLSVEALEARQMLDGSLPAYPPPAPVGLSPAVPFAASAPSNALSDRSAVAASSGVNNPAQTGDPVGDPSAEQPSSASLETAREPDGSDPFPNPSTAALTLHRWDGGDARAYAPDWGRYDALGGSDRSAVFTGQFHDRIFMNQYSPQERGWEGVLPHQEGSFVPSFPELLSYARADEAVSALFTQGAILAFSRAVLPPPPPSGVAVAVAADVRPGSVAVEAPTSLPGTALTQMLPTVVSPSVVMKTGVDVVVPVLTIRVGPEGVRAVEIGLLPQSQPLPPSSRETPEVPPEGPTTAETSLKASLELPPAQAAGLLDRLPFALDALEGAVRELTAELPADGKWVYWGSVCGLLGAALAVAAAREPAPVVDPLSDEELP